MIWSSGPVWLLLGVWNAAILTECKIFMNYQWYPIWLTGEQLLGLCASRGAASAHLRKAHTEAKCVCVCMCAHVCVCVSACFSRDALVCESTQPDVCVWLCVLVSVGLDIRRNNCVFNSLFSRWWMIILEMIKRQVSSIRICACQSNITLLPRESSSGVAAVRVMF